MPRGSNARGRRSERRATARRDKQQGVNEALTLVADAEVAAVIPDSADYRPAAEGADERCSTCTSFEDGECSRFDAAVDADYVCNEFEARATAASDEENFSLIRALEVGFTAFDRALLAAGVEDANRMVTSYDMLYGSLCERKFLSLALESEFVNTARSSWPSEATLADHGEVVFRDDSGGVFLMPDKTIVYAHIHDGWARVQVAAPSREAAASTFSTFQNAYPPLYREAFNDESIVPITFWTNGKFGPSSRLRMIDSASWADIQDNYGGEVKTELERLMTDFTPGADGQLLLWQGSPGTGKTWALRALASEWSEWAEFSYITDPDAFFVSDPSYMIDVLLTDTYEEFVATDDGIDVVTSNKQGKWRVLILEDTGELLAADAKESYGQGVSRLLNVVDGMVGQGLRVLAIVTTNEQLSDLHEAVTRPGRCASQIAFGTLNEDEANAWLKANGGDADISVSGPVTLAELYSLSGGGTTKAFAAADDMPCANCDHMAEDHYGEDNMGACSIAGCSCDGMEIPDEGGESASADEEDTFVADLAAALAVPITAAGEVVWAPDEGVMDLMCDINALLNAPGSWRWWVSDVSLDLKNALICDCDEDSWYVAGLTVGSDNEPTLDDQGNWVAVDEAWVVSEEASARRNEFIKAQMAAALRASGQTRMTFTLRDFEFTTIEVPAEMAPGATLPEKNGVDAVVTPPLQNASALRWTATLCPEGVETDDGRIFAPGSIEWRELPLSLMGMIETQEGHDGAQVCGRIDAVWREDATGLIRGSGEFDTGDFGSEIARMVDDKTLRGISVDIAVSEMEVGYRSSVLDENGRWRENAEAEEVDSLDVLFGDPEEPVLFIVRKGIIGAATVCPFQAFREATIETAASLVAASQNPMVFTVTTQAAFRLIATVEPDAGTRPAGLTASAVGIAPESPPAEWFTDPELDGPTALTVTDDGRVFGHAALWDVCHIGLPGGCTTAPESHSDYAYFHLKEIALEDGTRVSCGTITIDGPHAGREAGRASATAHYDNTCTAVADVVVGEDDHGIWVAGALRADSDAATARKLRGAALSGDWRDVNGNLELVALLAVNVPGFPIPRTQAAIMASGEEITVVSLVAAGMLVDGKPVVQAAKIDKVTLDAFAQIAAELDDTVEPAGNGDDVDASLA